MRLIFLSASFIFIIDRITKEIVLNIPKDLTISSFLTLSLTKNKGIAFGLFSSYSDIIFWIVLIMCIGLIIYSFFSKKNLIFKIGIGMFIGGGISNLFDRILYNYVIDFISIKIGSFYWPTFNIADCAITIGAILILLGDKRWSFQKG